MARYTPELIERVRRLYVDLGMRQSEVSEAVGLCRNSVSRILQRFAWSRQQGKAYPDDLVELARRLYVDEGKPATEVARRLGFVSRSAVQGLAFRQGWKRSVEVNDQAVKDAAMRRSVAQRIATIRAKPVLRLVAPSPPPKPPPPKPEEPMTTEPVPFMTRRQWPSLAGPAQCPNIVVNTHPVMVCGKPVERGSYCRDCAAIFYITPQKLKVGRV